MYPAAQERLALIRESGYAPPAELRRKRIDGSEFVAEVVGSRYLWKGRPATLSFIRDASERIEADLRRAQLEDRWRKILELAPEAVFVHSGGVMRYVNPATVKMFGAKSPEDLLGRPVEDFIHPDDREMLARKRTSLTEGWRMPLAEARRLRLDGSVFHSHATGAVIEWDGEQGALVIVRDVTEQLTVQQKIAASEARHRAISQAIPEAVIVTTRFKIVFANMAAAEMLGVDHPDDLLGRKLIDTVHPDEREQVLQSHSDLDVGEVQEPFVGRRLRDNGELFHAETVRAGYSWNGDPALLVVIRDITERKRAENALRVAQQAAETASEMKTRFLANMSHELRTPLNAIIGFSEAIHDEHFGPVENPRYVEYAGDISRSGQHLLALINDLLDLSKVEAGQYEIADGQFDLTETVQDAVRLLRPLSAAK